MKHQGFEALQRARDFSDALKRVKGEEGMQWLGMITISAEKDGLSEATSLIKDLEELGKRAQDLTARIVD